VQCSAHARWAERYPGGHGLGSIWQSLPPDSSSNLSVDFRRLSSCSSCNLPVLDVRAIPIPASSVGWEQQPLSQKRLFLDSTPPEYSVFARDVLLCVLCHVIKGYKENAISEPARLRCTAALFKAGVNVPGNSIWILGQKTGYGVAVCGEKFCELEAQTIVRWAFEHKVVFILDQGASADQGGTHLSRWLCSHRQVSIPLYPQLVTGAPIFAKGGAVARVTRRAAAIQEATGVGQPATASELPNLLNLLQ
jgi:hypothetical protein